MQNVTINGKEYFIDFEQCRKVKTFMEYKELLYMMVGLFASKLIIHLANVDIYENYPQYREFITLKPNIT